MDLGAALKAIRKQRNQTQKEFAKHCGITQTYLSQIESNLKEPNLATLKSVCDRLEIPLPIFFFLSMTEEDVQPSKRKAFNAVSPSVKSLVNDFFAV